MVPGGDALCVDSVRKFFLNICLKVSLDSPGCVESEAFRIQFVCIKFMRTKESFRCERKSLLSDLLNKSADK